MKCSSWCLASLAAALCFTSPTLGQPVQQAAFAPLEDGKLYLNVGTVDTAGIPNMLGQANMLAQAQPVVEAGKTYVLQLTGPMTPVRRAALQKAGVVIGDYLPKHAYTVDLAGADSAALATLPFVGWVGDFQNDWKLDPELGKRAHVKPERKAMAARGEIPVIITLFNGRPSDEASAVIRAIAGAVIHYTEPVGGCLCISATIPLNSAAALKNLDSVQYIEEAPELTLRNSSNRWIVQSNVTNDTPLYDNGIHGEGQVVGVLDGRADQNHCSLNGGKILAFNSSASPVNDHGTHVSATAVGDNGVFDNTRGVAYLANLVFNTIPSFSESGITQRLNLHHSQGARIHTNSWGDDSTTAYNSLARGFDVFLHDNEDDLVCLAVTNTGSLQNPENAKNLLAVGATSDTPSQSFHCTGGDGPTADGRRKPEIYAPGCGTLSANGLTSCGTRTMSGTSMASPAVAGTGALVRQYYVDGYYPSGVATPADAFTPSGALIKATLLNSAVDMTGVSGYPSNREGWGRVLADNGVFFAGDVRKLVVLDDIRNAVGLSTNDMPEFGVTVDGATQQLRVTLVWTDAPAAASTGTGFAAINDLDLEVVSPSSVLYLGNVFSGGQSATGGAADIRNNVEQVHLSSPELGVWTIRVRAAAVNQGTQGFALIATGQVTPVPTDLTPPSPDPMQWEPGGEPAAISTSEITMTAALATDTEDSVEYCLMGLSGPGVGSLCWQATRTFTDTGLSVNTIYSYEARARDTAFPPNEASPSPALSAATFIESPAIIFFGPPTDTSVGLTAFNPTGLFTNLAVGSSGLFFEMTPPGGVNANVWVQTQFVDVTGLTPGTEYTVRVKARNQLGDETPFTVTQTVTTTGGCTPVGDVNQDGLINGLDIDGYLRAKLGQAPALGEDPLCADFGNGGDLTLDTAAFVNALLLN